MTTEPQNILLFDGVCNLCNNVVQFTIKRDRVGKFKFAALQSEAGQTLLKKFNLPKEDFDSFVLVQGDKFYLRSTAGLHVLKELGGHWRIFYILILFPSFLRDFVYTLVAKSRYKIFGRTESCMMPTPELKSRFLD
ncbi:thiol-disulfide oxidoreductase DCC family protein [Leptospira ilyithenensis]|uniref:Thiol-disulfide oxidoreductase DCC family protein n=1 Tax=Leptospira ilyithenensis TaxID=2484901 RepID=A0A4R9LQ88_9LEPT|nr:thiol-disulfide oxidoreductase DCC family protein [Leptospira ilyithenensis]TGN11661.1 thiol-disulfide oxidoreductase DCC family protein [Leptospira ilyithenensis]